MSKKFNKWWLLFSIGIFMAVILDIGYVYIRLGVDKDMRNAVVKGFSNEFFLKFAAHNGNNAFINFLLNHGSDIHADQDQPLIFAVQGNHLDTVKLLVTRGANIHAKNNLALWIASGDGNLEIVKFLLDQDANITGCHGSVMVGIAEKHGHKDVASLIAQHMEQSPKECNAPLK